MNMCNNYGFTLIEIIAVMVIVGLLAAVAVPRYVDLENNAKPKAIDTLKAEINGRESLINWAKHKISESGYVNGEKIFTEVNFNFDPNYKWNAGDPKQTGGTLQFKGESFTFLKSNSFYRPKTGCLESKLTYNLCLLGPLSI